MPKLEKYSNYELIGELEYRGYNFLDDISDYELEEEVRIRNLGTLNYYSDKEIQEEFLDLKSEDNQQLLDNIYLLYKSYICNDPNFDANLKKFFSETLNINVV